MRAAVACLGSIAASDPKHAKRLCPRLRCLPTEVLARAGANGGNNDTKPS